MTTKTYFWARFDRDGNVATGASHQPPQMAWAGGRMPTGWSEVNLQDALRSLRSFHLAEAEIHKARMRKHQRQAEAVAKEMS